MAMEEPSGGRPAGPRPTLGFRTIVWALFSLIAVMQVLLWGRGYLSAPDGDAKTRALYHLLASLVALALAVTLAVRSARKHD